MNGFGVGVREETKPALNNEILAVSCKCCLLLSASLTLSSFVNTGQISPTNFSVSALTGSSSESRDSPTTNHAHNPAFALDANDPALTLEDYQQSSTYASFQRSGRITPPATTIPRFRKYCVDDFNFLKVLGKGSFGKVNFI